MTSDRQLKRRDTIRHIISMTGIADPKEIHKILEVEYRISVDLRTVYNDLKYLQNFSDRWLSDTLKTGWNIKLIQIYKDVNQDVAMLRRMARELQKDSSIPIMQKLGKIVFCQKIIVEHLQFLSEFMTNKALYTKMNEYLKKNANIPESDMEKSITDDGR